MQDSELKQYRKHLFGFGTNVVRTTEEIGSAACWSSHFLRLTIRRQESPEAAPYTKEYHLRQRLHMPFNIDAVNAWYFPTIVIRIPERHKGISKSATICRREEIGVFLMYHRKTSLLMHWNSASTPTDSVDKKLARGLDMRYCCFGFNTSLPMSVYATLL